MHPLSLVVMALVAMTTVGNAVPQNWPYRDNMEYYGYQNRGNFYRASDLRVNSGEDDDEIELPSNNQGRQDLKVATGQSPSNAVIPPVVVETGSAKPVASVATDSTPNTKQGTQPVAKQPSSVAGTDGAKQPAFPPATPPSPPTPTDEDSEEDSDEEEEADDDQDDDEDEDEENEGRNDELVVMETNATANATVVKKKKPVKGVAGENVQTVEALVPGYVTEQGEVLVPFDTVVKEGGGVVAVVEDPSYTKPSPPVVILPSDESDRPVPKFFNPSSEKQLYYSEVPPPGSIFTFDDDNEVGGGRRQAGVGRQGETSSEEVTDDESASASAQDDDTSSEESPPKPPLSHLKATAPSGEDDEAESLGIRIARMSPNYEFYGSRTPNHFYAGNGYYVTRYPAPANYPNNQRRVVLTRPHYEPEQRYYDYYSSAAASYGNYDNGPQPIYYYRPASREKVRVVPVGSFDVSVEESGEGESGFHYTRPTYTRPAVKPRPILRRPGTGPSTAPSTAGINRRIILRRTSPSHPHPQKSHLLAVYNVSGGTPTARLRSSLSKQRREAKELKKKKVLKKASDPLGLLKGGNKSKKVVMVTKNNNRQ